MKSAFVKSQTVTLNGNSPEIFEAQFTVSDLSHFLKSLSQQPVDSNFAHNTDPNLSEYLAIVEKVTEEYSSFPDFVFTLREFVSFLFKSKHFPNVCLMSSEFHRSLVKAAYGTHLFDHANQLFKLMPYFYLTLLRDKATVHFVDFSTAGSYYEIPLHVCITQQDKVHYF